MSNPSPQREMLHREPITRGDRLAYLIFALYFVGTAGCLIWQYRVARRALETVAEERVTMDRHAMTVRLGRDAVALFSPAPELRAPERRAEHVLRMTQSIRAELTSLRRAMLSTQETAHREAFRRLLAEVERPVEAVLTQLAVKPELGMNDPRIAPSYREAMDALFRLQILAEKVEAEQWDKHQEPLSWQQDVGVALGALLLLLAGGGALYLYRSRQAARAQAAQRAALMDRQRLTEKRYREIFENATEGIFQATPDGKLITANKALARMYGYESPASLIESLAGIGMQTFAHAQHRDAIMKTLHNDGAISNVEIEVVRADGRSVWVRENVRAVRSETGQLLYFEGTVEDISDEWWSEQRRLVQQATGKVLESASSVAEARPMMLNAICDILGWDMGAVWDVDVPAGVLRCVEVWHTPEIDIAEFEKTMARATLAPGQGLAGQIWREGQPKWSSNLGEDHSSPGALIAQKNGMGSVYGVPIKVNGEVRHVAEFFSPQISVSDPELLQLFSVIGTQLGHLIERKTRRGGAAQERDAQGGDPALGARLHRLFRRGGPHPGVQSGGGAGVRFPPAGSAGAGRGQLSSGRSARWRSNGDGTSSLYDMTNPPRSWGRRVEMVAVRSDGTEFPVEVAISRIKIDGKPMFTAFLRDISERKEAGRLTFELAAVVANSNDAIIGCTRDGLIQSWNVGAERIYGYTASEIIGRPLRCADSRRSGWMNFRRRSPRCGKARAWRITRRCGCARTARRSASRSRNRRSAASMDGSPGSPRSRATSPSGSASRRSCCNRRRWKRWAAWRAASRTISTTSSPPSWATAT